MKMLYCLTVLKYYLTTPPNNKTKFTLVRMKDCLTRSVHLVSCSTGNYKIPCYPNAIGHVPQHICLENI